MPENIGSEIIAIAALGKDTRAICVEQELLWRIPEDLKRVKQLTMGHPLVMGRKTYESIGKPLPGRTNIIITNQRDYEAAGCVVAHSLDEALEVAKKTDGGEQIYIFGGGEIYKLALPKTTKLVLTLVDSKKDGTAHFPEYKEDFVKVSSDGFGTHEGDSYEWATFERK